MARFGDMLYQRRRELGLSIQQVANTIKIRPQIIEFFEKGDFSSMPPRGYAQGMISSYARYLELNPREVVDAYFEELRDYELATSNTGGRFQEPAGMVSTRSGEVARQADAPGSAPRSRYAQRPPQAGYVSEVQSGHEPQRAQSPYARSSLPSSGTGRGGAGATAQLARTTSSRGQRRSGSGSRRDGQRPGSARGSARGSSSSTRAGSVSSRTPNRSTNRTRNGGAGGTRGGQRPPQRGGSGRGTGGSGVDGRLLIALIAAVVVIIVLLALLLMRGCTSDTASTDGSSAQSGSSAVVTTTETDDDTALTDAADAESADADVEAEASGDSTESEETVVLVSVDEGDTAWLEVRLDGSIVYGDEVVGPFEQEYTVTDSIRITTNDSSAVSVTQNGETVRWDTSTSGVARITISAPETSDEDDTTDEAAATDDAATTGEESEDTSTDG